MRALIAGRLSGADYEISLLYHGDEERHHYSNLESELCHLQDASLLVDDVTWPRRLRWKLKRAFGRWVNPRMEEKLQTLGATFVYPFASSLLPSADWISDFQYAFHPDKMSREEVNDRNSQFTYSARNAQHIVLSSAHAQRHCLELFPVTRGRTSVLQFRAFADPDWLTVDPHAVASKYNLAEKYVLVSNWLLPTKNHFGVLWALAQVPEPMRRAMRIVMTGDVFDYRNPGYYNKFFNAIHELGLHNQISVLGVIPKSDQIQLLRAATAYLQPSFFEGWNTGVEEAHLFGKPILLSDIPVHREQAPARARYFNPHDVGELSRALCDVFEAAGVRARDGRSERAAMARYAHLQAVFSETFLSLVERIGASQHRAGRESHTEAHEVHRCAT